MLSLSLSMDTDDKMETYHRFIQDGKDVARKGDMHKALDLFKLAYKIHRSQKLESRIKKLEDLAENDSEEEDKEFVNVNNSGLMLFKELHDKLYDYQRDGVAFLYSLYRDGRKGGILADDMGLGKTIQVISFLSGMYDNEQAKHTLLILPNVLITNWTKEFAKWTPEMRVKKFYGTSKSERAKNLEKVQRRNGVIITTYTMLINNWQQLASYHGKEFTWDYMILDEAHKIKSASTKTAKSAYAIPSKNRVLLTGTPVQNNLREMWALFDFACQGTLLGTAKTFKTEYENPITRAREKDATPGEKALGCRMSENLMTIIKPYFLRRTKSEVQKSKMKEEQSNNKEIPNHQKNSGATMPTLTRKNDLIVWTYLSAIQEDIYRQFISLDHVKELLMTTRTPLAELTILKKLCDHPRLLSAGAMAKLGLDETTAENQQNDDVCIDNNSIANTPDETLISESGKLVFLVALLERLRQEGHRTLVFAHYRKVLDIIERILGNRGFKVLRLDGTVTQLAERERLITLFQKDERYSVFLLTTQVGGVGLTLTAANRVVIYDPSWNPATDAQAVDRAYRIGQTENVIIYRLITCGTVEEKIYRRQVFKDSLIRQNTGDKKNPFRYFSKQELKELFILEETRSSSTQLQLQALHSRYRRSDPELDEHIAHLHTMEMFGISDHDLMFSLNVNHDEDPEDQEEHQYIEGRVQKAQELMKAESELQLQLAESLALSTEPAWLRPPVDCNRELSQEKNLRNPKPSPSYPQHDSNLNGSPVLVEMDNSSFGKDNSQQYSSNQVIDLIADDCMREDQPVEVKHDKPERPNLILDSPKPQLIKQERSYLEAEDNFAQEIIKESVVVSEAEDAAETSIQQQTQQSMITEVAHSADLSVQELVGQSVMSETNVASAGEGSPIYITSVDDNKQQLNTHSEYKESKMDLSHPLITPLQNKRLSLLQASNLSLKMDSGSVESLEGNFNLQLEDSDMFSDHDVQDGQETEAEQKQLLSQLQMEGSFDVNKSLSKMHLKEEFRQSLSNGDASEMDTSQDSIVVAKRKRAAVIYDSEEEGDDCVDERQQLMKSQLDDAFQQLVASTPKSVPSVSTPLRSSERFRGNSSVASRRSLLQSLIEDLNTNNQDMADDDDESSNDSDFSEKHAEEGEEDEAAEDGDEAAEEEDEAAEEEDEAAEEEEIVGETLNTEVEKEVEEEEIIGSTDDELQQEEMAGETNTEEEEEEEERAGETSNTEGEEVVEENYIFGSTNEEHQQEEMIKQQLVASTPKSVPSVSTPLRSSERFRGNSSVASRRSLLQSLIEDLNTNNQDMADDDDESSNDSDFSEKHAEEGEEDEAAEDGDEAAEEEDEAAEEEDEAAEEEEIVGETLNTEVEKEVEEEEIIGSTDDELQQEEMAGETNTEEEEEEEEEEERAGETSNTEGEEVVEENYIFGSTNEEHQQEEMIKQQLVASTPKSVPSVSTPLRSSERFRGNSSVASRRSLLQSLIEDLDINNQDMADDDESSNYVAFSDRHGDEAERWLERQTLRRRRRRKRRRR
ncbi:DNA excision repair protein ERCC-6-like [Channa argus]|uniref:DNA excision repair protein ERCC-6-like n=1 Tax=Channa argus TaxID=215402 RepID=A0A6G1PYD0_CHAAH|nr:DNA excision repair protein ERCC-6-like [Channa argus]